MFKCDPTPKLVNSNLRLMKNKGDCVSQYKYSQIIGCLMYVMYCTKPDIASTVGILSRYTSNPGSMYWITLNSILRYLKGTINYGLRYGKYHVVVEGHSDATWNLDLNESKLVIAWIYTLAKGVKDKHV